MYINVNTADSKTQIFLQLSTMSDIEFIYCRECGKRNMAEANYCMKCGCELKKIRKKKSKSDIKVEVPLEITNKRQPSYTKTSSLSPATPSSPRVPKRLSSLKANYIIKSSSDLLGDDEDHPYAPGKYMHLAVKGRSSVRGKILKMKDRKKGGIVVKLDNGKRYNVGEQYEDQYAFVYCSDDPFENEFRCDIDKMNKTQKWTLLFMFLLSVIIDVAYIAAWSLNELNRLNEHINCGIISIYDTDNGEQMYYGDICTIHGDCDMKQIGQIVLIGSLAGFGLHNALCLYAIFVTLYWDRFFMKSMWQYALILACYVLSAIIVIVTVFLWREGNLCEDACGYLGREGSVEEECAYYEAGMTQNLLLGMGGLSAICGAGLFMFSTSKSFNVT